MLITSKSPLHFLCTLDALSLEGHLDFCLFATDRVKCGIPEDAVNDVAISYQFPFS